ncbi:MAG: glycosyltransferase family 2 protein [Fidelibacterota bacterium]
MTEAGSQLKVTVIIVTYNSEGEIGGCLETVIPQIESVGGEVIVVDNASTDETVERIKPHLPALREQAGRAQRDDITLIVNEKNLGFSRANNQALEKARGEFVFLLNPDTRMEPGTVGTLIKKLKEDETLGAVAPQLRFPDGRIQYSCRRFPTYGAVLSELSGLSKLFPHAKTFNGWKMGDFDHRSPREVDQPAAAALMIRTDLLRRLGGFDEDFWMFFSDVDLCRRIGEKKRILFTPEAVVIHRGGASVNPRKASMIVSSHRSFIRYFRKWHRGPVQQVMNILMAVLLYLVMGVRVVWAGVRPAGRRAKRRAL